jgi:hypothetical protein
MIQRVMPELMGIKNILILNDEAHHCYREKPGDKDDEDLKGEDRKEAEKNNEAARVWISGLEAVNRKLGLARVCIPFKSATQSGAKRPGNPGQSSRGSERSDAGVFLIA